VGIGKNSKSAFCRKGLTLVDPFVRIPDFGRFRARKFGSLLALNLPHSVAHATGPGSRTHGLEINFLVIVMPIHIENFFDVTI